MNSGMAILYVQCHTTQEISLTVIEWLQIVSCSNLLLHSSRMASTQDHVTSNEYISISD